MRLVWHIAKKDMRRLAPAAGVWLGLLVMAALVMTWAAISDDVARSGDVRGWLINLKVAVGCLTGTAMALGTLLVAQLVQEDPLTGSAAMWRTRPMGAGRLWLAKVCAVGLVFVGAPVVALTPVWLASGFSLASWWAAASGMIATQAILVVVAGGLAAITKDLGAFVFSVAGVVAVVALGLTPLSEEILGGAPSGVQQTRMVLMWPLGVAVVAAAGAMQYLTQRTRWAWMTLGLGLAMMVAVRIAWPWDSLPERPGVFGRWGEVAKDRRADLVVEKIVVPTNANLPLAVTVAVPPERDANQFSAPWNGRATVTLSPRLGVGGFIDMGGLWGEEAVKRVIGLAPNSGPVKWGLVLTPVPRAEKPMMAGGATAHARGNLRMARMQARVMGELPWNAGAVARVGASATRIVSVGQLPGSMEYGVMIEERDAVAAMDAQRRDCFALVNRRMGIFKNLPLAEQGAVEGGGLRLSARTLTYEPPMHVVDGKRVEVKDWERDAVLVKVRFEVIERWQTPVVTEHVPIVDEGKIL